MISEESLFVSGKLPTYPSPKPTLSLTSQQVFYVLLFSLKAKCCPRGGVGGQFPVTYNDSKNLGQYPYIHLIEKNGVA